MSSTDALEDRLKTFESRVPILEERISLMERRLDAMGVARTGEPMRPAVFSGTTIGTAPSDVPDRLLPAHSRLSTLPLPTH